jgi:hypothetical protein
MFYFVGNGILKWVTKEKVAKVYNKRIKRLEELKKAESIIYSN